MFAWLTLIIGFDMQPLIEPAFKPKAEYHDWDFRYLEVVRSLVSAMSPLPPFLAFEHVGSTAITGCGGKGVIDLFALYKDGFLEEAKHYLLAVGFRRQGSGFSHPWPEHRPMFFGNYRWKNDLFLIYVHIIHYESDEVRRFRTFKERLAANPELISEYCELKRKIVFAGQQDTDEYKLQKRPFMHKVLGADYILKKQ